MTLATLERGSEVLESLAEVFAEEKPCEGIGALDGACGLHDHPAEVWMRFTCSTPDCGRINVKACCKQFVARIRYYADASMIMCRQCGVYSESSDFKVMGEV